MAKTFMGQLCEFVLEHPGWKKAFPGFSRRDVIVKLVERRISGGLLIATYEDRLRGIVIFKEEEDYLRIEHIIGEKGMVRWALLAWRAEYPNLDVRFDRVKNGVHRQFRLTLINTVNILGSMTEV